MSTTNLVDDRQKSSGPSVASTGQAASAESLQHQTPSLENLLARAMPQAFGRIAENQEQEDEPMGGEESDSAASMRSATSSNSQLSTGSLNSQQNAASETPRDSAATPSTPRDDKNQTLSVSAPDLAAARQRQASAEAEGDQDETENSEDKTVGADDAMEEDDEEEETMEDEEDDDDDDDDESSNENQEKLVELLAGERGLFDKLKEVITGESEAKDSNTNEAQKNKATKKPKKWFKKMSSYTDVLKGLFMNVFINRKSKKIIFVWEINKS